MSAKCTKNIFFTNFVQSKQYQSVYEATDNTKFNLNDFWYQFSIVIFFLCSRSFLNWQALVIDQYTQKRPHIHTLL